MGQDTVKVNHWRKLVSVCTGTFLWSTAARSQHLYDLSLKVRTGMVLLGLQTIVVSRVPTNSCSSHMDQLTTACPRYHMACFVMAEA